MLLLVPHLFPSARLLDAAAPNLRLPALEALLARGTRQGFATEGVEAALCETLGIARQQDWPLAPISLQGDGGNAGTDYWLRADPVHLQVMRDRIVLAGGSIPDLGRDQAEALAGSLQAHFGAEFDLRVPQPQRWYLRLPEPPRLATTPLPCAAGRDIEPLLPRGADALRFRTRLNELQMVLHDHPVNQAREARGQAAVNSLWLWGGGTLPRVSPCHLRIATENADARALADYAGATLVPMPARVGRDGADVAVLESLLVPGQVGDAFGWREGVRQVENQIQALLQEGPPFTVADPISGVAYAWRTADRYKFWCRRIPLREALEPV